MAGLALLGGTVLLLPILGGLYVVETLSVIAQVISFRGFGRRVLRMAPDPPSLRGGRLARVHGDRAPVAVRRRVRGARPRPLLRQLHQHPRGPRVIAASGSRVLVVGLGVTGDAVAALGLQPRPRGHRRRRPTRDRPARAARGRRRAGDRGRGPADRVRRRRAPPRGRPRGAQPGRPRGAPDPPGRAARRGDPAVRGRPRRRAAGGGRPHAGRDHRHQRQDHGDRADPRDVPGVGDRRRGRGQHRRAAARRGAARRRPPGGGRGVVVPARAHDGRVPAPRRGAAATSPTTTSTGTGPSRPTRGRRRASSRPRDPTTCSSTTPTTRSSPRSPRRLPVGPSRSPSLPVRPRGTGS